MSDPEPIPEPIRIDIDALELFRMRLWPDEDGGCLSECEEQLTSATDFATKPFHPDLVPATLYPAPSSLPVAIVSRSTPTSPLDVLKPKKRKKSKSRPAPVPMDGPSCPADPSAPQSKKRKKIPPSRKSYKKRRNFEKHAKQDRLRAADLAGPSVTLSLKTGERGDLPDLGLVDDGPSVVAVDHCYVPPPHKAGMKHATGLDPIRTKYDFGEDAPVVSSGWSGDHVPQVQKVYSLAEAEKAGCRLQDWNGVTPRPILDRNNREVGVLMGHPNPRPGEKTWPEVAQEAFETMEQYGDRCTFDDAHSHHRRGNFRVLTRSLSYGGGRMEPGNRVNTANNTKELSNLCKEEPIKRIAHFQSRGFQLFAPEVYNLYYRTLLLLLAWGFWLVKNFDASVFAAITFNFGPITECFPHVDEANLAWGWCAITALGNFDYTRGGHLILWDLKIIVPFPPGSTILIPSALVTHSNTPIERGKKRLSITQYSASGLFRWVYNGMRSDSDFLSTASAADKRRWKEVKEDRWEKGYNMLPTFR